MKIIKELVYFAWIQALCCIFPVIIFGILGISKMVQMPFLHRYDFILLMCLLAQAVLVWSKLESIDELKMIALFHLIGLGLELFKVNMGSWSYPEAGWSKIWGVPLYSGFMYTSVASYVCQAWRRLDLHFMNWPKTHVAVSLAVVIYVNFFTHHFMPDLRWLIVGSLFFIFKKTQIGFTVTDRQLKMPAVLSYFLIAFFIWLAENISTFLGAWKYPNQMNAWQIVHWGKISSWFLLVIISIVIVVELKHYKMKLVQKKRHYRRTSFL